jgi:hypothetical protein
MNNLCCPQLSSLVLCFVFCVAGESKPKRNISDSLSVIICKTFVTLSSNFNVHRPLAQVQKIRVCGFMENKLNSEKVEQ